VLIFVFVFDTKIIFVFGFFFSVCPYKLHDGCQKIHHKK